MNVAAVSALQVVRANLLAKHRRGGRDRPIVRAALGRLVLVTALGRAVVQSGAKSGEPARHPRIRPEPVAGARTRGPARGRGENSERTERHVIVFVRQERREVLRRRVHVPVGAVVQDDVGRPENPQARRQGERLRD